VSNILLCQSTSLTILKCFSHGHGILFVKVHVHGSRASIITYPDFQGLSRAQALIIEENGNDEN
jgi:hypothetical protein